MTDRAKMLESIVGLLQSKDQSNVDVGFLQLLNFVGGSIGKALQYYAKVMVVFHSGLISLPTPHHQCEGFYVFTFNIPFIKNEYKFTELKNRNQDVDFEGIKNRIKTGARQHIIFRGKEILEIIK